MSYFIANIIKFIEFIHFIIKKYIKKVISFARFDDYLYIYVMFVRRKVNKSGSVSIQVLDKRNGRNVLLRSFGASKKESIICEMERLAYDFINTYGGQLVLDFDKKS